MTTTQPNSFFLDSNIFLGGILEYETFHRQCKRLLTSKSNNYTSVTVRKEVTKVIARRKKYYNKLLISKYQKTVDINEYIEKIALYESDVNFLKNIRKFIINKLRGEDWYGMYRTHLMLIEQMFDKCLASDVINPLIKKSIDKKALNGINTILNNRTDSQILLDMIYEFKAKNEFMYFTTSDYEDFINNEEEILHWVSTFFKTQNFFGIIGISKAISIIKV